MRRIALAIALMLGLAAPAAAQAPPAVPALPDTARVTTYSLSASTCSCSVGFALYQSGTDVDQWISVYVNGVAKLSTDPAFGWALTSATGSLGSIPRPITNAVLTFNTAQTASIIIVGNQRPRRLSQFSENRGVPARDLNQAITTDIAALRELWDKSNRSIVGQPGETLTPLPSGTARAGLNLGFDGSGNPTLVPPVFSGGGGTLGTAVSSNTALSAIASTAVPSITRLGFTVVGDSPPILYKSTSLACTLNAGAGDGGSQVPTSDGKCWVADLPTPAPVTIWGAKGDGSTDNSTALQSALTFIGTNGGCIQIPIDAAGGNFLFNTALTLSPTAQRNTCMVGPGKLKPSTTLAGVALTVSGNTGPPYTISITGITLDLTNITSSVTGGILLSGTAVTYIEENSFNTDQTGTYATNFFVIGFKGSIFANSNSVPFWTVIRGNSFRPFLGLVNQTPPYCVAMYGQTNAVQIYNNAFTQCQVSIAGLPDLGNGEKSNAVGIYGNWFESTVNSPIAIEDIGNPAANAIVTGTYTSGTGIVSLTLTNVPANLVVGSTFTISSITGTGADLALVNGLKTATAGTSGTTVNFSIGTGHTVTTITGGNFAQYGLLSTGWNIHGNRSELITTFFKIGSTGTSGSGDQPFPSNLHDNYFTGVTNYISNVYSNTYSSYEPHAGGLLTGVNTVIMGAEGLTYNVVGGIKGFAVTGDLSAIGTVGTASMRFGTNGGLPTAIWDGGVTVFTVDNPGSYLRFIYNGTPVGTLTATAFSMPSFMSNGSVPTLTGSCGVVAGTQHGGTTAGDFAIPAGNCAATTTVIMAFAITAPTGWACDAHNLTTPTSIIDQTGKSATGATFTIRSVTAVAADVVTFKCEGY